MKLKKRLVTALSIAVSFGLQTAPSAHAAERIVDPAEDINTNFNNIEGETKGGAIYNEQENGINISGRFEDVKAKDTGGAIYNSGSLGAISATFSNNVVSWSLSGDRTLPRGGGAIFSSGSIDSITDSIFDGNLAQWTSGGAIFNSGSIGFISAAFSNNASNIHFTDDPNAPRGGGAVFNSGSIDNITNSSFDGNQVTGEASGGALYNTGTIGAGAQSGILGSTFTGNIAQRAGGAICNSGHIYAISAYVYEDGTRMESAFEGNHIEGGLIYGGAIYNNGQIDEIDATFFQNYLSSTTSAWGGAIYNDKQITSISGNFEGNTVQAIIAYGGAISNSQTGTIESISGTFTNNNAIGGSNGNTAIGGGAIYNSLDGSIGCIDGIFTNNHAESDGNIYGGAIYTYGSVNSIYGEFSDNAAISHTNVARGGALSLNGLLSDQIKATFTNNYVRSYSTAYGGAIYSVKSNAGASISGAFTGNYAFSQTSTAAGGAIYFEWAFGSVNADFENNNVIAVEGSALGGAIFNYDALGSVTGSFVQNTANSEKGAAGGGAIANYYTIKTVSANFSGNSSTSQNGVAYGGAIYNNGSMGEIKNSSFVGNYVQGNENSNGGAIYTSSNLTIVSDNPNPGIESGESLFSGNWVNSEDNRQAIYLAKTGGTLTLRAENGGRITFDDRIDSVGDYTLTMTGDNISSIITLNNKVGCATASSENITLRIGLTDENMWISEVFADATLDVKSGIVDTTDSKFGTYKFKGLNSSAEARYQISVAITEGKEYCDVFDVTESEVTPGSVITLSTVVMHEFDEVGDEIDAPDKEYIFQIIKRREDQDITLAFESMEPADKAKPHMTSKDTIADSVELISSYGDDKYDSVKLKGWKDKLAAWAELNETDDEGKKSFTIMDTVSQVLTRDIEETDVIGQKLLGNDITIKGENANTFNLQNHNLLDEIREQQTLSLINLNIINGSEKGITNAGTLNMDTVSMDDTFKITNDAVLNIMGLTVLNNSITSNDRGKMHITSESAQTQETTILYLGGAIRNQDITHGAATEANPVDTDKLREGDTSGFSTTTYLGSNGELNAALKESLFTKGQATNSLSMQGGIMILPELGTERMQLRTLTMGNGVIYIPKVQVNLATQEMGGIDTDNAETEDGASGVIWLGEFEIIEDASRDVTHVKFVDGGVSSLVQDGYGIAQGAAVEMETARYRYLVTYHKKEVEAPAPEPPAEPDDAAADQEALANGAKLADEPTATDAGDDDPDAPPTEEDKYIGYYSFSRISTSSRLTPGSVTQRAAVVATMIQLYDYAFMHTDLYADSIYRARRARLQEPDKTVTPAKEFAAPGASATQVRETEGLRGGAWLRPYSTYERLPLSNGPKVDTSLYGALIGFDTALTEHRSGWGSVFTGYLGYNGARLRWDSYRTRTNGGVIGITETLYKNNFFAALTAAVDTTTGDTSSAYGTESYNMLSIGLAARAGYNIEFGNGKYVLQPAMQASYTLGFVDSYTNAEGIRIKADPMHSIQLHPMLKFITHTESEWKPYLVVGMVWTLNGKTRFKAEGDKLPGMGLRPYVEYGAGIQKTWRDRYTFYSQLTGRSLGRQGAELSAGIRYAW